MSLARRLGWPALLSAGLGVLVAAGNWLWLARQADIEAERIAFLRGEIVKLDAEIDEVSSLKLEIAALLARKNVVEVLQRDRAIPVLLLDDLARQRPAGLRLTAVREERASVFISGAAQSDAAVATLLDNLSASPLFFANGDLVELRSGRFSVRAFWKARPPAAGAAPRFPSDVHPGDPK